MNKAKAGNQDALRNIKIKKSVSGNFKQGAYAVMSKNILLMKKTNNFIGINDLISIGTIGLIKGINSFNPSKSVKLSTYVSRCIDNEILMFLRSIKYI